MNVLSLCGDEASGYWLGHKRTGRIVGFGTEKERESERKKEGEL